MGVVYRAFDTHLDRPVAIKILRADATASPERKRRFVLEAKSASAVIWAPSRTSFMRSMTRSNSECQCDPYADRDKSLMERTIVGSGRPY
jgi:serine/threonine protein kinase